MPEKMETRYAAAMNQLNDVNQTQVLQFWDSLDHASRDQLLTQIEGIDWPEVARLVNSHVKNTPHFDLPENVEPAPWYPYEATPDLAGPYREAKELGEQLIRKGKVAAFTVAGGQGTRLGWDGPKGTFPATPIRGLTLFACFAEYIRNVQSRFGCVVPWYVMTSPINDAATRAFFKENRYFGLDAANVKIFPQAMMPAIEMATGKVLLAAPDSLALSPNGHGGSLKALWTSGAVEDMKQRGVEHISYTQVDNPIVRMIDPLFIGLHAQNEAEMSSKMLPKREPLEKLGNFCLVDGKMTVIEYSDLPDELAYETLPDGSLRFRAGSIAIHAIRTDFVEHLNTQPEGFGLPFHRAEKKVPFVDGSGQQIQPSEANAVKLETFVFDALPLCESSIIYETDRGDEFAPIKNADGEGVLDSPASSKALQIERAAKWLEASGVKVPRNADGTPDCRIEIKQTTAIYPEDLRGKALPGKIEPREDILL